MDMQVHSVLQRFMSENAFLAAADMKQSVISAYKCIETTYETGNKILVCGNGGSAADADHIVGELVKGFRLKRPLLPQEVALLGRHPFQNSDWIEKLQGGLPAINLSAHTSLMTAIINDQGADVMYAQQVLGYGNAGDTFIGISTSGNSENVIKAACVAKSKKLSTILLTGVHKGDFSDLFDVVIQAPSNQTSVIQDMHSVIYHALCAMIEWKYWSE